MLQLSHKKLIAYIKAKELCNLIYIITKQFPSHEQYNLISQMRRAALSICSNISEGGSRESRKEKKRFYQIARGSLIELDTQLEISGMLKYIDNSDMNKLEGLLEENFRLLSKMISTFSKAVNTEKNKPPSS